MNKCYLLLVTLTFLFMGISYAQYAERQDVIWARMVPAGTITLDGNLNEAEWGQAESVDVTYGIAGPLPTSAWRPEFQPDMITDPTHANVKFLVSADNQLYLGFTIPDSSIGGNQDWARWDGILMSIKDKLDSTRAANAVEYFYSWWYVNIPTYVVPGAPPRFVGRYGNFNDTTRTPEQRAAWDAVTVVNGTSNDAGADQGWVVEMRMDLSVVGYNVTDTDGDIVAMNFSIWDCDKLFSGNPALTNSTRTWYQSPWGNANAMNVARVFARPDVTTATTTLPVIGPDVIVPNGSALADPVIDGNLDEVVWQGAYNFDIAWGDNQLRSSYPTTGPLSSGQFQPELGGNPKPPVLDPAFANIKMFFKDNFLYLGADVNDQVILGTEVYDQFDGVSFIIGDRQAMSADNNMVFQRLRVNYNILGQPAAYDYLTTLVDTGLAQFGIHLKGASTVNNNSDVDEGYQIELKVDLTGLGYPANLGDKLLFMGVMLGDGDSFEDSLSNYGTRTWWFREHDGGPAAAWMVMDPNVPVDVKDVNNSIIPASLQLYGNYPNPFNPSTQIKFGIPSAGNVDVEVFNSLGQRISGERLVLNSGGTYEYRFNAGNISSGVYYYRVVFNNSDNRQISTGKMILLK